MPSVAFQCVIQGACFVALPETCFGWSVCGLHELAFRYCFEFFDQRQRRRNVFAFLLVNRKEVAR